MSTRIHSCIYMHAHIHICVRVYICDIYIYIYIYDIHMCTKCTTYIVYDTRTHARAHTHLVLGQIDRAVKKVATHLVLGQIERAVKEVAVGEDIGVHEVEQRVQLVQVVLHRGACGVRVCVCVCVDVCVRACLCLSLCLYACVSCARM